MPPLNQTLPYQEGICRPNGEYVDGEGTVVADEADASLSSPPPASSYDAAASGLDISIGSPIGHPLLCREIPANTESISPDDFRALIDCRLQEIRQHVEAGRLDEATAEIRRTAEIIRDAPPHGDVSRDTGDPRAPWIAELYQLRADVAGRQDRTGAEIYYRAEGFLFAGNMRAARALMARFVAGTRNNDNPDIVRHRAEFVAILREQALASLDRLGGENARLAQERGETNSSTFLGFTITETGAMAPYNREILRYLRNTIETGAAETIEGAIEVWRRDYETHANAFLENPVVPEGSRIRLREGMTEVRLTGGTLELDQNWRGEVRVVVGPEGGAVRRRGDVLIFPPRSGERTVVVRPELWDHEGLVAGRDYMRRSISEATRDGSLDPVSHDPLQGGFDAAAHFFRFEDGRAVLRHRDEVFHILLDSELESAGAGEAANPATSRERLMEEALRLSERIGTGGYVPAIERFRTLFQEQFNRVAERFRAAGITDEAEIERLSLGVLQFQCDFLHGIKDSEGRTDEIATRAFRKFVELEDPFHDPLRISARGQVELTNWLIENIFVTVATMGVGAEIEGALLARFGLSEAERIGATLFERAVARGIPWLGRSVFEGSAFTGWDAARHGRELSWKDVVASVAMMGGFHGLGSAGRGLTAWLGFGRLTGEAGALGLLGGADGLYHHATAPDTDRSSLSEHLLEGVGRMGFYAVVGRVVGSPSGERASRSPVASPAPEVRAGGNRPATSLDEINQMHMGLGIPTGARRGGVGGPVRFGRGRAIPADLRGSREVLRQTVEESNRSRGRYPSADPQAAQASAENSSPAVVQRPIIMVGDETVSADERPTMPPPADMPRGTPRAVPAVRTPSRSLPRSATAVGLAVHHANAHLADETGFRFAIESELVSAGDGETGTPPTVEVRVAGPEAEMVFMNTLREMSASVTVEDLGDGSYHVRDESRGESLVTVRRGLELSLDHQRHLGEWLNALPLAEREGMRLSRYSPLSLRSLFIHLNRGHHWTPEAIEGLFLGRGISRDRYSEIIGSDDWAPSAAQEGQSGAGAP